MSRLLHAAARGARIQSQWRDDHDWQNTNQFVFIDWMRYYRIHPDDEHLQYGPVSTALREIALTRSYIGQPFVFSYRVLAIAAANEFQVYLGGVRDDYPLFYLFLAEFLADEGM